MQKRQPKLLSCFETQEQFLKLKEAEKNLSDSIKYSNPKKWNFQVSIKEVVKQLRYIRAELKAYELAIYADYEDYFPKSKFYKPYINRSKCNINLPEIIGLELLATG